MAFFQRYGDKSVFIGRFFGPLRTVIPLAAGIAKLRPRRFWRANILSALVWAPALLLPRSFTDEALRVLYLAKGWEWALVAVIAPVMVLVIWAARRVRFVSRG